MNWMSIRPQRKQHAPSPGKQSNLSLVNQQIRYRSPRKCFDDGEVDMVVFLHFEVNMAGFPNCEVYMTAFPHCEVDMTVFRHCEV